MVQQIPLQTNTPSILVRAAGDLTVRGSDRQVIETNDSWDEVSIRQEAERWTVTSRSDCSLVVPVGAVLELDRIGGDGKIRDVLGEIKVRQVGGDLSVNGAGPISIEQVGGDCAVRAVRGALTLFRVGGDLACNDVQGDFSLEMTGGDTAITGVGGEARLQSLSGDLSISRARSVAIEVVGGDLNAESIEGDLTVRKCRGDLACRNLTGSLIFETIGGDLVGASIGGGVRGSAAGDARLVLSSPVTQDTHLNAGGDISCEIPPDVDAFVRLGSSSRRIRIAIGDRTEAIRALTHEFRVGEGRVQLNLNASGKVELSAHGQTAAFADESGFVVGTVDWDRMTEKIRQGVDRSIRASLAGTDKFERAEQKARRALERAEQRVQSAMRRMQFEGFNVEQPVVTPPPPPPPPAVQTEEPQPVQAEAAQPVHEPVTDEERLMILRMVQDKKITIEQAEQLLEALDEQDLEDED